MEAPTTNPPETAVVATSGFITCRRWKLRRQIHRRRAIWEHDMQRRPMAFRVSWIGIHHVEKTKCYIRVKLVSCSRRTYCV
ncbi:hypothetical protein LINPERPRIM_LOCUS8112 [Linum perenne]